MGWRWNCGGRVLKRSRCLRPKGLRLYCDSPLGWREIRRPGERNRGPMKRRFTWGGGPVARLLAVVVTVLPGARRLGDVIAKGEVVERRSLMSLTRDRKATFGRRGRGRGHINKVAASRSQHRHRMHKVTKDKKAKKQIISRSGKHKVFPP